MFWVCPITGKSIKTHLPCFFIQTWKRKHVAGKIQGPHVRSVQNILRFFHRRKCYKDFASNENIRLLFTVLLWIVVLLFFRLLDQTKDPHIHFGRNKHRVLKAGPRADEAAENSSVWVIDRGLSLELKGQMVLV